MINLTFINSHKLKSPIPYIDVNRAYKRLLWELAIDFDQHFRFMAFLPTKSSRNPFTQFVISRKELPFIALYWTIFNSNDIWEETIFPALHVQLVSISRSNDSFISELLETCDSQVTYFCAAAKCHPVCHAHIYCFELPLKLEQQPWWRRSTTKLKSPGCPAPPCKSLWAITIGMIYSSSH